MQTVISSVAAVWNNIEVFSSESKISYSKENAYADLSKWNHILTLFYQTQNHLTKLIVQITKMCYTLRILFIYI